MTITKMKKIEYLIALALSGCVLPAYCQTLQGAVNKPMQIEILAKASGFDDKPCSVLVVFPDGEKKIFVSSSPDYKIKFEYTPRNDGLMVINWSGEESLDGKPLDNIVEGGVKQIFGNLGEILQFKKLSQTITKCASKGLFNLSVKNEVTRPAIASENIETNNNKQYTGEYKATAEAPKTVNNPIESDSFKSKYNSDPNYKLMVDGFNNERSKQSLTLLRSYSEQGDANAQFLFGLAHLEDWTGLYDLRKACYWIRQSAVSGLSQARLVLANRAFNRRQCFDVTPTFEEAKIWAQLASMSSDKIVKENADKLLGDILKAQISGQK